MDTFALTHHQFVAIASRRMRAVLRRDDPRCTENSVVELQVLDRATRQATARLFAVVTYIERVDGGMCVISLDPRLSEGSRPAFRLDLEDG